MQGGWIFSQGTTSREATTDECQRLTDGAVRAFAQWTMDFLTIGEPARTLKNIEAHRRKNYALKGIQVNYLRIDLKICEGCGALWLRRAMVEGVYCQGCAGRLAEFPAPRGKHAGGRRRRRSRAVGCTTAVGVGGGAR